MSEPTMPPAEQRHRAVRLIFSFDGEHIQLVSQQSVDMTVPPSDPLHESAGRKGFWYELHDAQDRPLYRRVMHNPMGDDVEAFSDDPKQTISRHPRPNRKGVFVVVVPDTTEGHTVTLSSSPRRVQRAHQPATEIARFALRKNP